MKFVSYHRGKAIPWWLGILIGLDQFLGTLAPGAHVDKTISHRLGVKRVKVALRRGIVTPEEVMLVEAIRPWAAMGLGVRRRLAGVSIPFWRHPLAAVLDFLLERVDRNHSLESIGA